MRPFLSLFVVCFCCLCLCLSLSLSPLSPLLSVSICLVSGCVSCCCFFSLSLALFLYLFLSVSPPLQLVGIVSSSPFGGTRNSQVEERAPPLSALAAALAEMGAVQGPQHTDAHKATEPNTIPSHTPPTQNEAQRSPGEPYYAFCGGGSAWLGAVLGSMIRVLHADSRGFPTGPHLHSARLCIACSSCILVALTPGAL